MTIKNYSLLDHRECENWYGFDAIYDKWMIVASFDPWTGQYLKESYNYNYTGILYGEFNGQELKNKRVIKKRVYERLKEWKSQHIKTYICEGLNELVIGTHKNLTRAIYLSMVRTYAVFRKGTTEEFDAMDYCPFCGAKLPERLDNKLSELLQKEYRLASWRDYKKAPHEFHTDEWWKKRGL